MIGLFSARIKSNLLYHLKWNHDSHSYHNHPREMNYYHFFPNSTHRIWHHHRRCMKHKSSLMNIRENIENENWLAGSWQHVILICVPYRYFGSYLVMNNRKFLLRWLQIKSSQNRNKVNIESNKHYFKKHLKKNGPLKSLKALLRTIKLKDRHYRMM